VRNNNNYLNRNLKKARVNDRLSKKRRSALMSRVRSKETALEKTFINMLRGVTTASFDTNVSDIKGKPDIVFKKAKVCIFIDSDFWHGWNYPRWRHLLKNNFWKLKIARNRKRDREVTAYLRRNGWVVIRIWEHQVKNGSMLKKLSQAIPKN